VLNWFLLWWRKLSYRNNRYRWYSNKRNSWRK